MNNSVVIIGGGPAGLMAAEQILQAGFKVDLYDAMPTVGRKFLLAGIGGLNITHSEPLATFVTRYGASEAQLTPLLQQFDNQALRAWCQDLGIETFVGSSGRVFPKEMKAAPLLRTWLARLKRQGLQLHTRHRWLGWNEAQEIILQNTETTFTRPYQALVLALGGASWKKLGSDGAWYPLLAAKNVALHPFQPANCGFLVNWSEYLKEHCAGQPLKSITLSFTDLEQQTETRKGELMLTSRGVEGSLIYAFSARLRDYLLHHGSATFYLDLCPDYTQEALIRLLQAKPQAKSWGAYLKAKLKLDKAKSTLFFEYLTQPTDITSMCQLLKHLPITVTATTPLDEAISTAGGVSWEALDSDLQLKALPKVFCVGEMLDWEAPTGGYLLNACFASGKQGGLGVVRQLTAAD
ncbi:NAD(P)/FAD-dependent oxidoreductase [Thiofilum flexile]|uniref:NAD(P)/FAD-dependent oxidoreductase n=1 Tax=Thiofilum flexile TaxID=125627 RepID=UPI00036A8519|nr:TIGR03862 family flavoprotein [Thiofilum flexile]